MRFSARSKGGILLSIITILTLVSAIMVTIVSRGTASRAASTAPITATYQGKSLNGVQTATLPGIPTKVTQPHQQQTSPQDLDAHAGGKAASKTGAVHGVPVTKGTAILNAAAEGSLLHNFNALSDLDQATANGAVFGLGPFGFEVTPPDQGLCVGHDFTLSGNPTAVFELINDAVAEYSPSGTLLRPVSAIVSFFADPFAFSDPRCFYDAKNHAFYFTIISFNATTGNTVDDVAVLDSHGFAVYQFDSSLGGTCFGDQPHVGYDNNNLYVATDEFCGPTQSVYEGALLIAISKSQLLQEVAAPNAVEFGPLVLGGVPILTLQPAVSPGVGTEYLLNSFPFDQFGNNNSIANTLGFWQVKGGVHVTTGGTVTLTGTIITSETYAFPQPAASTGNGSVTLVSGGPLTNIPVTSEAFLNPDDSRMQQVQAFNQAGDVDLYASLPTAINIPGDPSARDGVAWFKIDAESQTFEAQGYVAVAGSYLLYPAIYHTGDGTTALVFTITSPTLNPSAAYTVMSSTATSFGGITITATGAGPHLSFSDALFGRARWGDYSAAVLGPDNTNLWLATEYIPPTANQDPFDNWGTNIFEVAGAQ